MKGGRTRIILEVALLVTILAALILLPWLAPQTRRQPTDGDGALYIFPALALLMLAAAGIRFVRYRQHVPRWEPLKPVVLRWSAAADTAIITLGLFGLTVPHEKGVLFFLGFAAFGAVFIASANMLNGLHASVRELLDFYVTVSIWDVLTGRAPHEKVHPQCATAIPGRPSCHHRLDGPYRIRSIGDAIGYFFLIVPTLLTAVAIKASALAVGPLLYLGLAFDARDYSALNLEVRRRWRSSFKLLWVTMSVVAILLFLAKLVLYAYWNELAGIWNANRVLVGLTGPIAPHAFLPWHLTTLANAFLLLVLVFVVDRTVYDVEDRQIPPASLPRRLRLLRAGFRLRNILSVYNWFCFTWLLIPGLSELSFPPVSWQFLPR